MGFLEPRVRAAFAEPEPPESPYKVMARAAIQEARLAGLPREDGEDIGQIVILRFLLSDREIPDPAAWGRSVARHEAAWTRKRASREVPWTEAFEGASQPWEELEREWRLAAVLSAVEDRDRGLLGPALAGAKHGEVAARLGVAERDVGTMLRRASRRASSVRVALEGCAE